MNLHDLTSLFKSMQTNAGVRAVRNPDIEIKRPCWLSNNDE